LKHDLNKIRKEVALLNKDAIVPRQQESFKDTFENGSLVKMANLPPIDKVTLIEVIKHYGAPAYVDLDKKVVRFHTRNEAEAFLKR
jgi:hypothetical protein